MPAKKIVQDIVPSGRRSIRDIPLKGRGEDEEVVMKTTSHRRIRRVPDPEPEEIPEEVIEEEVQEPVFVKNPPTRTKKSSKKFFFTFLIVIISLGVIAAAFSLTYSKAIVTITPKVTDFNVNGSLYTAKKSPTGTELGYEVLTMEDEVRQAVPATQGSSVETKAKGTVVIYNNHSTANQTLVAGTRLADSDGTGLVYRTTSTISVPGKSGSTPGSIAVTVVADQPGETYNMKISDLKGDFKIVAYKGTDKYAGFYARLRDEISGGFTGTKMVVDPDTLKTTSDLLQNNLREQLTTQLKAIVPDDYVLYDSAIEIEFDIPEPSMKEEGVAEVVVKGSAYGPIFKSDNLVQYLAGDEIRKFPSETYTVEGEEGLVFEITNSRDFSAVEGTPMVFSLKGPISIVGTVPEEQLKEELKGIELKDSNAVFAKYPSISNAYALLTPFWLRTFPDTTERIIIQYK